MGDDRQRDSTDPIGELIRQAGRREHPTKDEYDRVFAAATSVFQAKTGRHNRRLMLRSIAAVVLVGIATTVLVTNLPRSSRQPMAAIDRMVGPAEVWRNDEIWTALTGESFPLFAANRIHTGPGSRLGVRMANGVSLRLAESTDIEFAAPGRIRLLSGKIYADAGEHLPVEGAPESRARRIMVETAAGLTWDIGTQFEVQYANGIYRLRVREGQVNLQQESRELQGVAGEQLTIDAAQEVRRDMIASDDPEWRWAEAVAPNPAFDSRPVSELLSWVSRETGRAIVFARPGLEFEAATTLLFGRVFHLEPLEALDVMLATTDFKYTLLEDGSILIDSKPRKDEL